MTTYIDDRTFAEATAVGSGKKYEEWCEASRHMGLRENNRRLKVITNRRAEALMAGLPDETIVSSARVLSIQMKVPGNENAISRRNGLPMLNAGRRERRYYPSLGL